MDLAQYKRVQKIAKDALHHAGLVMKVGWTEKKIAKECRGYMRFHGVHSFWYHNVPALVLVGERTTLSISGREYDPTDTRVQKNDLITIDLSPEIDGCWGDYARSFVMEDCKVVGLHDMDFPKSIEHFEGLNEEWGLHLCLLRTAHPEMTFEEVFHKMNDLIQEKGYENLDFKGNLGHSIENHLGKRVYIERGCQRKLGEGLFTFEPHIRKPGSKFGYKLEDIYYFEDVVLNAL